MSLDLSKEIAKLKKEKEAVILAHNYQLPQVQDIADYVGDSLELSIKAAKTQAKIIVFCGVYFMAETAKILSPEKKVIIPDIKAGCPMADMVTPSQMVELKKKHIGAKSICYVNTSAAVKAECDVCCTSANSIKVLEGFFAPQEEVIFVPDKNLAAYTEKVSGRKLIVWPGYCPIHDRITSQDILRQKEAHPNARVLVHPECRPEVTALADAVVSTGGMCRYVAASEDKEFIIGTEEGMLYRLSKDNPGKKFYAATDNFVCVDMKKITLDKVFAALDTEGPQVEVPEEIIKKAQTSIERMLSLS